MHPPLPPARRRARAASRPRSASPSNTCATPAASCAVGRHHPSGPSCSSVSSASASIRSIPSRHVKARSAAIHGSIDALPSGSHGIRRARLCRALPASAFGGSPREVVEPRAEHGDRRIARRVDRRRTSSSHDSSVATPPAYHAGRMSCSTDRVTASASPASLGIVQRRLGQPVRLTPRHRAAVELGRDLGLTELELAAQQVAEQVVIPVPRAAAIERDDEAIVVLERHEHARGVVFAEDRVAEGAAHPLEHRRARQEPHLVVRQPRQQLEPQIVGHEPIVTAERRDRSSVRSPPPGATARRGRGPPASPRSAR